MDITRLKMAEETLRDADRRKDEFLAMLAHELRNPLAPISNAVAVMGIAKTDPEAEEWACEVINRQVGHLSNLVNDLMDVSRITQGKITLTRAPLAVASFINAAIESSRPLIDARNQVLDVHICDEELYVDGDLTRLSQVVLNLLNNAAKYTPQGGHIHLFATKEGDWCRVSVKDDGEGIGPQMLPKVFDLFAQAARSLDRSQGGLGVGLTLVQRLVEMHGGTVDAHSDGPGKGSQFTVKLPLLSGGTILPIGSGTDADLSRISKASRRILIVDDSRDSTDSLSRLLSSLGHEVQSACDGPSAIEAAIQFRPNLVLLDIGLPEIDGYEVARRLRHDPSFYGIQLVAVTGYGSDGDRRRVERRASMITSSSQWTSPLCFVYSARRKLKSRERITRSWVLHGGCRSLNAHFGRRVLVWCTR